ncbi:MAG TPA: diaminopimelate decarboxylase [Caulobacteraceae bacterium]
MNHFEDHGGELWCEGVSLAALAEAVGTPVYVYSTATLTRHYRVYAEAFSGRRALVAYAVKANGNLSVLRTLARLGAGADTVSEGEIRRALAAGVPPERIIFSGMGKTDAELAFACALPGLQVNVESEPELARLSAAARQAGTRPLVVFRVNPDVQAGGHAKISTGAAHNKFGVAVDETARLYRAALEGGAVDPVGLALHIGSQISDLAPFASAWTRLRQMAEAFRSQGLPVRRLDLGGGLAVPYFNTPDPPEPAALGRVAEEVFAGFDVELAVEPGRAIAGNAGVLLSRVVHVNRRGAGPCFLVLDAGMNDLLRPTLYEAWHDLRPVRPRGGAPVTYDVVGPVCETSDMFGRDRSLPPLEAGDLVAFMSAGAYGATMSSEYNARPLVPEVLVDGERWAVVRPRPSYDEMLEREPLADWLR